MIQRINEELTGKCQRLYCIKGLVRIEESLDEVFELTLNSNYLILKPLKKVKGVVKKQIVNGFEKINIEYENFDIRDLGLLFYGENLEEVKLKELLKNYMKPVLLNYFDSMKSNYYR